MCDYMHCGGDVKYAFRGPSLPLSHGKFSEAAPEVMKPNALGRLGAWRLACNKPSS